MGNTEQNFSIWRYFTSREPFIQCNICNVFYESNNILSDKCFLKKHLEREHPHIIEEIKEEIKSTWLSRYFAFNIKCESIRCIFCEKDIDILEGLHYLLYHMSDHNIHIDTINYLKDDMTMLRNIPQEIFEKIKRKIQDEITSAGLSSYFIFGPLNYTDMKCVICGDVFNILLEKQILKEHLFLHHYISK